MENLFKKEEGKTENQEEKSVNKTKRRKPSKKGNKQTKPESFEKAIQELEELVIILENNEISLEKSMEIFERAQFLTQWCGNVLDKLEGKLKLLVPTNEGFELVDMEEE